MSNYRNGVSVRGRPVHEGVGNALRAAFAAAPVADYGLPDTMTSLLDRLR